MISSSVNVDNVFSFSRCCRMKAKSLGERFASTLLDQSVFARDMAKPVSEGTIFSLKIPDGRRRRTTLSLVCAEVGFPKSGEKK